MTLMIASYRLGLTYSRNQRRRSVYVEGQVQGNHRSVFFIHDILLGFNTFLVTCRPVPHHWACQRYNLHWFRWYIDDWPSRLCVIGFYTLVIIWYDCVLVRSAISIVPQSPDLFEGTLRENIDPVGEHSDVDIWIALDQVFLKIFLLYSYSILI